MRLDRTGTQSLAGGLNAVRTPKSAWHAQEGKWQRPSGKRERENENENESQEMNTRSQSENFSSRFVVRYSYFFLSPFYFKLMCKLLLFFPFGSNSFVFCFMTVIVFAHTRARKTSMGKPTGTCLRKILLFERVFFYFSLNFQCRVNLLFALFAFILN